MKFTPTILAALTVAMSFALSPSLGSVTAHADDLKVASGGAFKQVLRPLVAEYEKSSGNTVAMTFQTVGQHLQLIEAGNEQFDVAVLTPEAIERLAAAGKIVPGSRTDLARTGIGVVVKAGAPQPDIGSVEAFKRALLAAKSVAFIDPKAGGSSGIYVEKLLDRLGIADAVNAKAVLVQGGAVASHVADGEAEIGIHQISEILPVQGAVLVGPLPAEIQNFTVYAAGVATTATDRAAAMGLVKFLAGPQALPVITAKGMEPVSR
jgi:molybdate transport system substrate-binding protein